MILSAGAIYGFHTYYVADFGAEMAMRQTHLNSLKMDINKGIATARRLPEFQAEVGNLNARLESLRNVLPEQKDVADILRRLQGLATQSNLTLLRFTPSPQRQQPLYAEVPYRLTLKLPLRLGSGRQDRQAALTQAPGSTGETLLDLQRAVEMEDEEMIRDRRQPELLGLVRHLLGVDAGPAAPSARRNDCKVGTVGDGVQADRRSRFVHGRASPPSG